MGLKLILVLWASAIDDITDSDMVPKDKLTLWRIGQIGEPSETDDHGKMFYLFWWYKSK